MPAWYEQYPWLTLCVAKRKAFCLYCRYGTNHGQLTLSKMGENVFTITGFNYWKKALEKFRIHSGCSAHKEAVMK